jgi:phage terminase large subunit-like protein
MTSGNYVMDGRVQYDSDNLMEKYNVKGIAYDRWNSLNLIRDLEGDGVPCDPFGQGYASMSFPSKAWEKLALEGKLWHGGDEVLRWMMSNVVIKPDPSGNIKVDKSKSGDKIDGVVAGIMAIGEMLTFEEEETHDFEFFMEVMGV